MKRRFDTAPVNGRGESARLAAWLVLVLLLIALGYGSRLESGKPDPQVLYRWSTAVGGLIQDAIVLGIVLAVAGGTGLLALRRPVSWKRAAVMIAVFFVAVLAFEVVYSAIVHPGNEQGLTPKHWEPRHAAAYIGNAVVICGWVPFVEEITFRGLGYTLLERFGTWPAILTVGVLFGLAHGLVLALPIIAAFGCALGWMRAKTRSVIPGMLLHAIFNLFALILAVTIGG